MSRLLRSVVLVALATCWLNRAIGQPTSLPLPGAPIPEGLITGEFFSPAVNRAMKFDLVLPPDYQQSDRRYPVLYLLHGHLQNYTVWGRSLGAAVYARQLGDLILVMPDGGNSWFVNYAGSAPGQSNDWADYLIEDLIPYVDQHYRTVAAREGRAIAGLSMGGYAAITLALKNPDLFVSMGSTSGALGHARTAAEALRQGIDLTPPAQGPALPARFAEADRLIAQLIDIPGFSTQQERTPIAAQFETPEQALAYDPFELLYQVPKSRLPHIYLDAGTEDSLVRETREFMQILLINGVPFDFRQARGGHNAAYWRESIGHLMAIQYEVMQRALGRRP